MFKLKSKKFDAKFRKNVFFKFAPKCWLSVFSTKKHSKSIFLPVVGVGSTQTLLKIYNADTVKCVERFAPMCLSTSMTAFLET